MRQEQQVNIGNEKQVSIYDFVPVALLGSGSYGDVYLVENVKNGEIYAMKKLDKEQIAE